MRYISMIRAAENTGQVPSERMMQNMGKPMDELTRAGQLISTGGLRPTSEVVRMRWRRGELSMTDGPFTESKEVIGGYAIFEPKSKKEEAVALTRRFLAVHGNEWDIECELRQLAGPDSVVALRPVLRSSGSKLNEQVSVRRPAIESYCASSRSR